MREDYLTKAEGGLRDEGDPVALPYGAVGRMKSKTLDPVEIKLTRVLVRPMTPSCRDRLRRVHMFTDALWCGTELFR